MYHTAVFKTSPTTWKVVFEEMVLPDGQSNKGRVQAYDGAIDIADAALYLVHAKPEPGIKDPYELNEDKYKAALDLLRGQRKLVSRYWHDAMVQLVEGLKVFGYYNAGQDCTAVCGVYAGRKIYAKLVAELGATVSSIQNWTLD